MTCCTELGLTDGGLRLSKSADSEIIGKAPTSTDLTAYDGEFVVRETDASSTALLTVTTTPTVNGSVILFSGNLITLRLKMADITLLPLATDPDEPWVGVCELVVVADTGLRSRVFQLSISVERGVVR